MIKTLSNWLKHSGEDAVKVTAQPDELARLVAALMVEAAASDGEIASEETELIFDSVRTQFALTDSQMRSILDEAVSQSAERIELHSLMRRLREHADYEERIGVLEMVWMVVLADGRLDQIEAQLMRRLAGLLFVSDVDSGLAAKTAKSRLGIAQ